jgi:hypothetical protein
VTTSQRRDEPLSFAWHYPADSASRYCELRHEALHARNLFLLVLLTQERRDVDVAARYLRGYARSWSKVASGMSHLIGR